MKIVRHIPSRALSKRPLYLAMGFFDGMHRGHQKVIQSAVNQAKKMHGQSCVLTFAAHPLAVLAPDRVPVLLTPGQQRVDLIAALGVDACILLPFNRTLSKLEPEAFTAMLACSLPQLREAFVGVNWRFGRGASGDSQEFKTLGRQQGFAVTRIHPVLHRGTPISSTRIREAIRLGKLEEATRLLGRSFSIIGKVQRGQRLGRQLGFPTANIHTPVDLALPHGVYVARVRVGNALHPAVVNFGIKPTLRSARATSAQLEAHLLNFKGSLYGKMIEIFLLRKIRQERTFPSFELLQQQIRRDILRVKRWFSSSKTK